jgi:hypothetical protein
MYRDVGGIVVVSSILFVAKSDSVPKGLNLFNLRSKAASQDRETFFGRVLGIS